MEKAGLLNGTDILKSFTDVLYFTKQDQIPPEVRRLFKEKKASYLVLPIDEYPHVRNRLDLIGTVVIDTKELNAIQQQKLAGIIESLETENIGVILLTSRVELPIKSFSLSPTRTSFSMAGTLESVSIDELWTRISVNIACRQRSSSITARPTIPTKHLQRVYRNKLAEQLSMTEALVDNLAEQLRLASLVQQDFLPTQLPNSDKVRWATVFLPAEWVSGDIYNVVRIDEQHIGFYVADVVGHGMPAALLTIFLKQAFVMRETTENNYRILSPAEAMRNLNIRMSSQKLSGYQFATCCYCLLNTETLQLTCARAGHPYPTIIKPGEVPQQLEVRGSLLGIFREADYIERTVQLQRGDKVWLYSDGAEPFTGYFDDQTGFNFNEEFCKIKDLPVGEMADCFKALVQKQKDNIPEIDDITVVGLEIL
jgi:serine phosphatase RsbU (regulator of sigma subunit)